MLEHNFQPVVTIFVSIVLIMMIVLMTIGTSTSYRIVCTANTD